MKNKKILIFLILIIVIFLAFYFYKNTVPAKTTPATQQAQEAPQQKDISKEAPYIVSTKPDPLDESMISAAEVIEITFNRPLENVGEFKSKIEPKIEYKVELSGDRRTAKIIPAKPYSLGTTYTLFIGTETKFDGVGRWGEEKVFHFKTIKYTGV